MKKGNLGGKEKAASAELSTRTPPKPNEVSFDTLPTVSLQPVRYEKNFLYFFFRQR